MQAKILCDVPAYIGGEIYQGRRLFCGTDGAFKAKGSSLWAAY